MIRPDRIADGAHDLMDRFEAAGTVQELSDIASDPAVAKHVGWLRRNRPGLACIIDRSLQAASERFCGDALAVKISDEDNSLVAGFPRDLTMAG